MNTPRFAFFDVDNTLINLKSMLSFHDYWYQHWLPAQGRAGPGRRSTRISAPFWIRWRAMAKAGRPSTGVTTPSLPAVR